MKTVDFIRRALESSAQATLPLIDDMKDAPLTSPTPKGGNHPLWVLGHLAHTEGELIQHFMLGRENPVAKWAELFARGSQPSTDASKYPSLAEVQKAFDAIRAETMKTLDSLTDADLDRESKACPPEFKQFIGTYGGCFLIVIMNTMTHRGQVADARRAAGRKPLRM
jgi:uncharacterized damage-inducible protein DinB